MMFLTLLFQVREGSYLYFWSSCSNFVVLSSPQRRLLMFYMPDLTKLTT